MAGKRLQAQILAIRAMRAEAVLVAKRTKFNRWGVARLEQAVIKGDVAGLALYVSQVEAARDGTTVDFQNTVAPSPKLTETILWTLPSGMAATIEGGQINFQSGGLSGPTPSFWLYARQVPVKPLGYGDGWTMVRNSEVKRVDGKPLRAGGSNNNCNFGVGPGLGSTAPCYAVLWKAPMLITGPYDVILIHGPDGPGDGYEVRFYGTQQPA